eukprot:m.309091 g.309091  ORF g.309091 m.309091 type:complete len:210 (+) comp45476_c0_seq1:34-663(+)
MGDVHLGGQSVADSEEQFDCLVKLLALGDSDVGKTSLLLRYVDDFFDPEVSTTIGIDFKEKIVDKNGQKIYLQLWDTAGQERYKSITSAFYHNAYGFMIVFDLTNSQTFMNCRDWISQLHENCSREKPDLILVGNKCDLPNRAVTTQQGTELAHQFKMEYIETSAKEGTNVSQMMEVLMERVMRSMEVELKSKARKQSTKTSEGSGCSC